MLRRLGDPQKEAALPALGQNQERMGAFQLDLLADWDDERPPRGGDGQGLIDRDDLPGYVIADEPPGVRELLVACASSRTADCDTPGRTIQAAARSD